jgi:hypothetical protein
LESGERRARRVPPVPIARPAPRRAVWTRKEGGMVVGCWIEMGKKHLLGVMDRDRSRKVYVQMSSYDRVWRLLFGLLLLPFLMNNGRSNDIRSRAMKRCTDKMHVWRVFPQSYNATRASTQLRHPRSGLRA